MENKDARVKNKTPWWKTAILIVGILFVMAIAKGVGREMSSNATKRFLSGNPEGLSESELKDAIKKGAQNIREQAPIKVDQVSTLTGAVSAGNEIIYAVSTSDDFSKEEIPAAQQTLEASNQQKLCSEPKTRQLIGYGAKMSFYYTDASGDGFKTTTSHCP